MNDIVISAENIGKCYRVYDSSRSRLMNAFLPGRGHGVQELWALRDVNFVIRKGESVALIGRNGGGKSTLLEILTGTLTPTTGRVSVHGRVCALLELGSGFNPEYSGRENVILNGLLLGLTKEQIVSRLGEIEAFAEIGTAIDRPVKTYSSGMMVRLAFAVQVLSDPDILIIDEALSVGDFFFQQKCMSYIRKLKERGVTLLFVSHDMGTVRDICDRGIFLSRGRLVFDGNQVDAIQHFMLGDQNKTENTLTAGVPNHAKSNLDITDPIWLADSKCMNSYANILKVGMFDENGRTCTNAKVGAVIRFSVLFQTTVKDTIHINVIIKNKYSKIVTATSSYTQRTSFPAYTPPQELLFEIDQKLSLEPGAYSFSVILADLSGDGTAGNTLSETPELGPIRLYWDEDGPPPFFGMVGLETESRIIIASNKRDSDE